MNRYLALLATAIVTSSLGNTEIHAKSYETVAESATIKDSTFTSLSGSAIRCEPPVSASTAAVRTDLPVLIAEPSIQNESPTPVSGTVTKNDSLTSVSGTSIKSEPFTSVSETTVTNQLPFSASGAAVKSEIFSYLSEATKCAETINTEANTHKRSVKKNITKVRKMSPEKIQKYKKMEVPKHNNFKSYMGYRTITCKASKQYKLQQKAKTGKYGIRTVKGRYLIAMGTYYTKNVGDKFDIKLSDGTILKCMIGDIKSNRHTDAKRQKQKYDGSIIEFITDPAKMPSNVKRAGSYTACKKFSGYIKEIRKLK